MVTTILLAMHITTLASMWLGQHSQSQVTFPLTNKPFVRRLLSQQQWPPDGMQGFYHLYQKWIQDETLQA